MSYRLFRFSYLSTWQFALQRLPTWQSNQYTCKLYDVFLDIDKAIRDNHGVKCYADGNTLNVERENIFYLHICDVLNIMVKKINATPIEVVVKSELLNCIPTNLKNEFETIYLKQANSKFLYSEIDFIYYCYCYLGNTSFVPIRTKIANDNVTFKISKFFINNIHFQRHQYGKMQEINQNGCGIISKIAYRTI